MKHLNSKMWVTGALGGVVLLGLLLMVCGLGLAFGHRTLSLVSFFCVIGLLGIILVIRKNSGTSTEGGD